MEELLGHLFRWDWVNDRLWVGRWSPMLLLLLRFLLAPPKLKSYCSSADRGRVLSSPCDGRPRDPHLLHLLRCRQACD